MSKLSEFVQAHQPESVLLSLETVKVACEKAGLLLVTDRKAHPAFELEKFQFAMLTTFGSKSEMKRVKARFGWTEKPFPYWEGLVFEYEPRVVWTSEISHDEIVYNPHIWNHSLSRSGYMVVENKLFAALGIETVVVSTPEPTVSMSIPKWVDYIADDPHLCGLTSPTVFFSEAKQLAEEFLSALRAQGLV